MGVVQQSKGNLKPVSSTLLSEPIIVCMLAKATLAHRALRGGRSQSPAGSKINWDKYLEHYDHIRNDIERTIAGFDNYNERVRKPSGFYLPNCNRDGSFDTMTKKAQFNIATSSPTVLAADELIMMTIRSHDQFNTTIYGLDDRYRGIYKERRVIMMNRQDMIDRQLNEGDVVDLINDADGRERIAHQFIVVPYPIPAGCTATYFPETNVLVPINQVAEKSNTPVSKGVIIKVQKTDIKR